MSPFGDISGGEGLLSQLKSAWALGGRSKSRLGKPLPAVRRKFPAWEHSRAILFQLFYIVPQKIGVGVEQSVTQTAAPSLPRPVPTTIHDDEARESHVNDLHFNSGWLVPHGSSTQTIPPLENQGRKARATGIDRV